MSEDLVKLNFLFGSKDNFLDSNDSFKINEHNKGYLYLATVRGVNGLEDRSYLYFDNGTTFLNIVPQLLSVQNGGTGKSTLDAGKALIGNGTDSVQTRAITDNISVLSLNYVDNLITERSIGFWDGTSKSSNNQIQYNLTKLGTIDTGTWQAAIIEPAYGGTGLNLSLDDYAEGVLYKTTISSKKKITTTNKGTQGQILSTDTNGIPHFSSPTITWNEGSFAGPELQFSIQGINYKKDIPVASVSTSGAVNNITQYFGGLKVFTEGLNTTSFKIYRQKDISTEEIIGTILAQTNNGKTETVFSLGNDSSKAKGIFDLYDNNSKYIRFQKVENGEKTINHTIDVPNYNGYLTVSSKSAFSIPNEKSSFLLPFYTGTSASEDPKKQLTSHDSYLIEFNPTAGEKSTVLQLGTSFLNGSEKTYQEGRIRLQGSGEYELTIIPSSRANPVKDSKIFLPIPRYVDYSNAPRADYGQPIPVGEGELTYHIKGTAIGTDTKFVYVEADGKIVSTNKTIAADNQIMYLNAGSLTASTKNIGTSTRPVYVNKGVLTAITCLEVLYGGTGNTAFTSNRMTYSKKSTNGAMQLKSSSHYVTDTSLVINYNSDDANPNAKDNPEHMLSVDGKVKFFTNAIGAGSTEKINRNIYFAFEGDSLKIGSPVSSSYDKVTKDTTAPTISFYDTSVKNTGDAVVEQGFLKWSGHETVQNGSTENLTATHSSLTLGSNSDSTELLFITPVLETQKILFNKGNGHHVMLEFSEGNCTADQSQRAKIVIGESGPLILSSGKETRGLSTEDISKYLSNIYLATDGEIHFYLDMQNSRSQVVLSKEKAFYPVVQNTGKIGTMSNNWESVHVKYLTSNQNTLELSVQTNQGAVDSNGIIKLHNSTKIFGDFSLTGNIFYRNSKFSPVKPECSVIRFYESKTPSSYSQVTMSIGGQGDLLIGSGSSVEEIYNLIQSSISDTAAQTYITSDNKIYFYANRSGATNNTSNTNYIVIDNLSLYPDCSTISGDSKANGTIGTSTNNWNTVHAQNLTSNNNLTLSAASGKVIKLTKSTEITGDLTLTGDIYYYNGSYTANNTQSAIRFIAGNSNGTGISIGAGGALFLGSGESSGTVQSALTGFSGDSEYTYISSDNDIYFYPGRQSYTTNIQYLTLSSALELYPYSNAQGSLGTSTYNWLAAHVRSISSNDNLTLSALSGKEIYLNTDTVINANLEVVGNTTTNDSIIYCTETDSKRILYGNYRNSGIKYDYGSGDECLMISSGLYSCSSIQFYTAGRIALNDMADQWVSGNPDVHIRAGCLAINYNWGNLGATAPSYNLYVNGTAYVSSNITTSGNISASKLHLTSTTDAAGSQNNTPALVIGTKTGEHIEIDNNEIMAKKTASTTGNLSLQHDGGSTTIGGALILKETISYGDDLPKTGSAGQIFFKLI